MSVYLKIADTDVSEFITENDYSVTTEPVYDEANAFVNIYGEKVRQRTGKEVVVSAVLRDVDDGTAAALSAALEKGSAQAVYSAPEQRSAEFEALKLSISLDRLYKGKKYWTAEIKLRAFVREVGL